MKKTPNEVFEAKLHEETIDAASERIRRFLTTAKVSPRDVLRYSMSVEEILLKSMEKEPNTDFKLELYTRFSHPFVLLSVSGTAHNIYLSESRGVLADSILKNLGLSPDYAFADNRNTYTFRIPHKRLNPFLALAIAFLSALIVGTLGGFLPDGIRQSIVDFFLTPLHEAFLNVLSCIAGPMVFLSVAWGIYGIGDAATLKHIGAKLLLNYVGTVFIALVGLGLISLPFFSLHFIQNTGGASELFSVFSMILDIFPENIFSPFTTGNTLQIIFLAVVIGIAMLFLGRKTNAVAKAVEQINIIVQFLIEFISRLISCFIFIILVRMIWSDSVSVLISVGKLFAMLIAAEILLSTAIILLCSLKNKVSPLLLIKKGLPTLLVGVTTASSAATFGLNQKACRKGFGIDETIYSFGLPLGMVAFKPSAALNYMLFSLFFAELFGVNISISWIIITLLASGILSIATPPIPGGAMTAYAMLFTMLGLPAEALAIALACDTIFDFLTTGNDQFLIPFMLLNEANSLGLVDRDTLLTK